MFSLRSYRCLREEVDSNHGKRNIYGCSSTIDSSSTVVTSGNGRRVNLVNALNQQSATSVTTSTTTTSATISSAPNTQHSASSGCSKSSSVTLHSIKAAWKSLSSLSFSSSRLPHLERAESTPAPNLEYRYTQFPTTLTTTTTSSSSSAAFKRNKETSSHHHCSSRSHWATPSTPLTFAQCLRRKKTKSKSDNALQKIGIKLKSRSDQNLHRVCFVGGTRQNIPPSNAIFSNVQLSGGSGDSFGSSVSSATSSSRYRAALRDSFHQQRSRSLERNHCSRIHSHNTRSLERNHKFRVHLRSFPTSPLSRDTPPDHLAPPPPVSKGVSRVACYTDGFNGSGGSLSICSSSSSSGSSSSCGGMEAGQGGSFINKPPRGWLHPDQQLAEEGICYGVRYIGALEVNTSMKSLNFDTRSLIAKECISKVCEAAGLKTADRKRKVVKSIGRILGERPLMDHAGSNVSLTITSASLTLTTLENGQVVASHDMPNISFASGGDPDTLDFIAYVAKDSRYGRACFVLECGGGLAQDVITTIGQAFELRFKEYLKKTPTSVQYTDVKTESDANVNGDATMPWNHKKDDREYYNDLPGKVPPDLPPPPVPPLPQYSSNKSGYSYPHSPTPQNNLLHSNSSAVEKSVAATANNVTQEGNDNLIDLSSEGLSSQPHPVRHEPEYANDAIIRLRHNDVKDPFDMQPFSLQLNQMGGSQNTLTSTTKPLPHTQRMELQREIWFHGPISRKEAELLLKKDGDFLVRESQGTSGQYVLTGIQNGTKKHLLLVDPQGVVRTKSLTFDSVSHLINFHRDNELPIVSAESALVLRNPVARHP